MPETTQRKPRRRDWARAFRALKVVSNDPKQTDRVIEIIGALAGPSFERDYRRFITLPEGRALLAERPSLFDTLSDRDALQRMPADSFARAYLSFTEASAITPEELAEADDQAKGYFPPVEEEVDPDAEFLGLRIRDMHDLWHVLTGYGTDEAGEAANLSFTLSQLPNMGMAFLVFVAAWLGPKSLDFWWQRYLIAAYRRGRATTAWLPAVHYEELLPLPLPEVRRRLGIVPAASFHPQGIAVFKVEEGTPGTISWRTSGGDAAAVGG